MPHSHHSHSGQFCRHAAQGTTLEQVVNEAIRKGFTMYGLTEHCPRYRAQDLYPEEADMSPKDTWDTFQDFLIEAHRLKHKYVDRIDLIIGVETDFITAEDLDGLDKLINPGKCDQADVNEHWIEYIVGSVHHVNQIPIDFDQATFEKSVASFGSEPPSTITQEGNWQDNQSLISFYKSYFDAQLQLLVRFKPKVVGHFDLCRLYTPFVRFQSLPEVWEHIKRNVKFVIVYGGLFELNAASFRKGWDEAYPGSDVLELIQSLGGKFCLSDDSHGPQAVGLNYGRLREYLVKFRVENIWYLSTVDGGRIEEKLVPKNWPADPFWKAV